MNFVKQFVELGYNKKIALIGQSNTFEKPDLDALPVDIVGSFSPHHTADDLNTPEWNASKTPSRNAGVAILLLHLNLPTLPCA